MSKQTIVLAGQPNCGKSTVFNGLTGAKQLVANYPGVTVDKMYGWYRYKDKSVEVIDLPGTYSLTSYSPEERVSRDVILHDRPSVTVNVMDASNLKRSLYLTFQLLEMETPMVMNLNMIDVAEGMGISIDEKGLSDVLGVPVVSTAMKTGRGKEALLSAKESAAAEQKKPSAASLNLYPKLEAWIKEIRSMLESKPGLNDKVALGWLAVKLLENDAEALNILKKNVPDYKEITDKVTSFRETFSSENGQSADHYIASQRYRKAAEIAEVYVTHKNADKIPLSERIDRIVCNRVFGPVFLLCVIYALYNLSIVQGYKLTTYTWPILAGFRSFVESFLPSAGFVHVPMIRELVLWFVDSVNALLNYIPIFFILFGLIAVLEDSGYMPRMAFIMDRLLSRYGLHGQSTLPMVLGGVVVGGCAVPAVMSAKGMPDERSRFATILIIPMLNCLAKVPMYILLINIYFAQEKAMAMFFISTISILFVLPVAKILSMTALKNLNTAPFIMEMPPYHIPTFRGVLGRAIERVWTYIRKITTVVAAVAIILFVLLQFPGLTPERIKYYEDKSSAAVAEFLKNVEGKKLAEGLKTEDDVMSLVLYYNDFKEARKKANSPEKKAELEKTFSARNPDFYEIVQNRKNPEAKAIEGELRTVDLMRRDIHIDMRKDRIENSFLGKIGRAIEPASKFAGFNWRVNVAILSSLAAKESSVATLGALYQEQGGDSEEESSTLEQRMGSQETGFTALHAIALMLFMVLCPPCFPTAIAVKVQTGSFKWMLFSFFYPLILGLIAATLAFSGGTALGLTGIQTMWIFYAVSLVITILIGFWGSSKPRTV